MCYIYQNSVVNVQVVNTVQVQSGEYRQLTGCFKYCGCETQIYTNSRGIFSEEETGKEERNDENKLQSQRVSNK